MTTPEHHAEAILRAAGSSLRHYEPRTREAILAAVREAVEAERKAVAAWLRSGAGADTTTLAKPLRALFLRGLHGYADRIESGEHLPTPPRGE